MLISKIEIENVKGIQHFELKDPLYPNRPNILVAPNGFGKSSFATAFASLQPNNIQLNEDTAYRNDLSNLPSLLVGLNDNSVLKADSTQNTIKDRFQVYVANNSLKPSAKAMHFGRITHAYAYMEIAPIVLIKTIPQKVDFVYRLAVLRRQFGASGKILPDISTLYTTDSSLERIESKSHINFHEFTLQRFRVPFGSALEQINAMSGQTAPNIINYIETQRIFDVVSVELTKLMSVIKSELHLNTDALAYLAACEYLSVRDALGTNYKKAVAYAAFLAKKQYIDATLDHINPVRDRFKIVSQIDDRSLVIKWPRANQLSGGQRDALVFIAQLMKCEFQTEGDCILVIDEFFDYLDDANLVAFQYYVSTIIDTFKKSKRLIFPILLTHLDPGYLKHFCFNDTQLNVCYLNETNARITKPMVKLVKSREKDSVKCILDQYYFHYNPNIIGKNFSKEFNAESLNADWSNPEIFQKKINRQLRTYVYQVGEVYDPLAVCLATRIQIERLAYDKLLNADDKAEFIKTHKTKEKLHFAQGRGVTFPEVFYLLGIVYNHPLHDVTEDIAKPLGMKLENPTIKNMIVNLWS